MSVEGVSSGAALESDDPTIAWLLEGDPAIRWQTMRELLDEPAGVWEAERRRVTHEGWVPAMLEHRSPQGVWPKGRWTDSPSSLLLLVACGLPEDHAAAADDASRLLGRFMPEGADVSVNSRLTVALDLLGRYTIDAHRLVQQDFHALDGRSTFPNITFDTASFSPS